MTQKTQLEAVEVTEAEVEVQQVNGVTASSNGAEMLNADGDEEATRVQLSPEEALEYLRITQEGKQWIANLHSHVFDVEHKEEKW